MAQGVNEDKHFADTHMHTHATQEYVFLCKYTLICICVPFYSQQYSAIHKQAHNTRLVDAARCAPESVLRYMHDFEVFKF